MELTIDHPVVAKVMVPAEGTRLPAAPIVNAPFTVKLEPVVVVPLMVRPPKVRTLEFVIDPPAIVIVIPLPVRVVPDPTVKSWSIAVAYEMVVVPVPEVAKL